MMMGFHWSEIWRVPSGGSEPPLLKQMETGGIRRACHATLHWSDLGYVGLNLECLGFSLDTGTPPGSC